MMTLNDVLAKINEQLAAKIDNALTKEVFEEIRDEEIETISGEVYGVYKPQRYRRRGKNTGLGDAADIQIRGGAAKGGKLVVVNTTQPNPGGCGRTRMVTVNKSLPSLVEHGHGYNGYTYDFTWPGGDYLAPRPFTSKTVEHLKESRAHVTALKDGLRRQGVKVK